MNLRKTQLFQDDRGATKDARLIMIFPGHRENKMISDRNFFLKLLLCKVQIPNCTYFVKKQNLKDTTTNERELKNLLTIQKNIKMQK